jgi:hypothetical protein
MRTVIMFRRGFEWVSNWRDRIKYDGVEAPSMNSQRGLLSAARMSNLINGAGQRFAGNFSSGLALPVGYARTDVVTRLVVGQ